jgi:DNA-binding GntR family transcriptional regulator
MRNGSLHDAIYASLLQALVMGDLVPGQRFSMRALADRFHTSLIPVRDALKRLVAERGLRILPNRTVCVPLMTRQAFQELLQVRLSLESKLARRGAELIVRGQVGRLAEINDEMQAAVGLDDVKQYLAANHRFHFGLYQVADSAVILPIVESLWMRWARSSTRYSRVKARTGQDNHMEVRKPCVVAIPSPSATRSSATLPTLPTSSSPMSSSSRIVPSTKWETRTGIAEAAGRAPPAGPPLRRTGERTSISERRGALYLECRAKRTTNEGGMPC